MHKVLLIHAEQFSGQQTLRVPEIVQLNPYSMLQLDEHPSSSNKLPSSQASGDVTIPSPQVKQVPLFRLYPPEHLTHIVIDILAEQVRQFGTVQLNMHVPLFRT